MVYYIRLLKPPSVRNTSRSRHVEVVVSLTSDLGDEFAGKKILLHSTLLDGEQQISAWSQAWWMPNMRSLPIQVQMSPELSKSGECHMLITSTKSLQPDSLCSDIPEILSMRCALLPHNKSGLTRTVERRFRNGLGQVAIREEAGESIARHIWDASLGLIKHLERVVRDPDPRDPGDIALWPILSNQTGGLHVLELGTGCGIVGIYLGSVLEQCTIVLTDLPNAMEFLDMNIAAAAQHSRSELSSTVVDWEEALPERIQAATHDLIVISDCTYNCDTVPCLVRTIKSLLTTSPRAIVLISMKRRHQSEDIFFELMSRNDIRQLQETNIPLSPSGESLDGAPPSSDVIQIHTYCSAEAQDVYLIPAAGSSGAGP